MAPGNFDPDLRLVFEVWPTLPESTRAAIVTMIRDCLAQRSDERAAGSATAARIEIVWARPIFCRRPGNEVHAALGYRLNGKSTGSSSLFVDFPQNTTLSAVSTRSATEKRNPYLGAADIACADSG